MNSADIEHWATTIAVALGVFGASWKWFFSEWLRKSREVPSLEAGDVHIFRMQMANGRVAILMEFSCRNTGSYPLHADCKNSSVVIAPASKLSHLTTIDPYQIAGASSATIHPFAKASFVIFEPGTDRRIQFVVTLEPHEEYFVAIQIVLDRKRHAGYVHPHSITKIAFISSAGENDGKSN